MLFLDFFHPFTADQVKEQNSHGADHNQRRHDLIQGR